MRFLLTVLTTVASLLSAPIAQAQDARETEFVIGLMESMNQLSVRFNREVCGYILQDAEGALFSTKVSWGGNASCASLPLEPGLRAISSWHTHAAWDPAYDGEVPSIQDVEGDMQFGVNGWVGTPGGRLWYVDGTTGTMTQACGRYCLPSDPSFLQDDHGPVAETYSLDGLYQRFGRAR